jgi:hypothetical protein
VAVSHPFSFSLSPAGFPTSGGYCYAGPLAFPQQQHSNQHSLPYNSNFLYSNSVQQHKQKQEQHLPFMGAQSDTTPCDSVTDQDGAVSGTKVVVAVSVTAAQESILLPLPSSVLMAAIQQQEELPELELEHGVFEVSPEKLGMLKKPPCFKCYLTLYPRPIGPI